MSDSLSAPLLNVHPPGSVAAPSPAGSPPPLRWLREPLLHFVLLGGLVFAGERFLGRADDLHTIVVGADVDRHAIETFEDSRGRAPTAEELTALRQVWLDNEVLYREGLAQQLDRGDPAIRERVIFKALSAVDTSVKLPKVDDGVLREWFEAHRDKYDEPARYDFEEAVLSGDTSEAAVRRFVDELNGGTPGDAKAGLRVFKGRPESNVVQSYGADFAKALTTAQRGKWNALQTREGWRAVRLVAITPPKPAVFEPLRGPVLQDWTDQVSAEQRTAAVRALAKKYDVQYPSPKK